MSTQSCFQNNYYVESRRNFLDDYGNTPKRKIDMTLSGTYLGKYPRFKINSKILCMYPSKSKICELVALIKTKFSICNEVIIGAGVNGILQNLIRIFIKENDNLLTPFYTFNLAEYGVTAKGGVTFRVKCDDFKINFNNIKKCINDKTRVVYICNPNNPTGIYVDSNELIKLANNIKIPLIIDESGIEFTGQKSLLEYTNLPKNIIVLRSFSKAYGLSNMRIGFMVCSKEVQALYVKNVSSNEFSDLAILYAQKMLNLKNLVLRNIKLIQKEKEKIIHGLLKMHIEVIKSDANIIMTKTTFNQDMLKKIQKMDISVVTVLDENDEIHLRIAVQDKKTNRKFIKAMKKVLENG